MFKVVLTLSFVSLKKVKDVFGYFVHCLKLPWYSTINFNLNFMLGGGGWGGGGDQPKTIPGASKQFK